MVVDNLDWLNRLMEHDITVKLSQDFIGHLVWYHLVNNDQRKSFIGWEILKKTFLNKIISDAPADNLATWCAKTVACRVMTEFQSCLYMRPVFRQWHDSNENTYLNTGQHHMKQNFCSAGVTENILLSSTHVCSLKKPFWCWLCNVYILSNL